MSIRPTSARRWRTPPLLPRLLGVALVVAAWQTLSSTGVIDAQELASPGTASATGLTLVQSGVLPQAAWTSLRFTTADIDVDDVVIPGDGQVVFLGLAAGDHDPARYAEPGTLDVRRDASGHLGFGHGAHACLGAPLGRMEARIAFRTLLLRCEDLAFAIDPADLEWRAAPQIRGLKHLPVTFTPGA